MSSAHRSGTSYRHLLLTLVGVYVAMVVLSGLNTNGKLLDPRAWSFDTPRFLIQQSAEGGWSINTFNQRKILEQAAINLTLGVGMTFVILAGSIDLSVGSILALCNVIFVRSLIGIETGHEGGLAVATAMALVAGLACGILNGWLVVSLRIPSFIATLGTLLVLRGLAYWASGGQTWLRACPAALTVLIPIGVCAVAVLVGAVFLGTTASGRRVYAVGGNAEAARYSGVRTGGIRILCFGASGLCAGLAGVIFWSRTATGSYTAGEGAELYAIAAVVLGGTRLAGGEGTMLGTLIGALIMAVLANGLNTASVHELTQKIIVGCVLITAAYIDSRRGGKAVTTVV